MLLLELLGVMAVYCKSGSYLPLMLLILLIPAASYGSPKKKWAATASVFGMLLLVFAAKNMSMVTGHRRHYGCHQCGKHRRWDGLCHRIYS